MNDILILVLSNGDQLLGEVTESDGVYVMKNVLQILTRTDEDSGQMNMGMIPYLPYATGDIAVPSFSTIIAIPTEELRNHYAAKFNLVIAPPEQKIFLG